MQKRCPSCGNKRLYVGKEIFCSQCGSLLERVPNRCSENRTELCGTARLTDEDLFCPFCRAPATYSLEAKDGE